MECKEIREMYKLMFAEYPDIVTVKDGLDRTGGLHRT